MVDAVIIPFPSRVPADPEERAAPEHANARLRAAMESLQGALLEQRRALSDWRFAMTELGIGVAGLGHSLAGYQDALGGVDSRLTHLRDASKRLEAWADAALESATQPSPGVGKSTPT
jgi:hypothetical protein